MNGTLKQVTFALIYTGEGALTGAIALYASQLGKGPAVEAAGLSDGARRRRKLLGIPGLEKLGWASILPEFDPYRYNSFAFQAGCEINDLAASISERLRKLSAKGGLKSFPRVTAFQSVADSTAPAASVVENLFRYLGPLNHELILFDLHRFAEAGKLMDPEAGAVTRRYLNDPALPFDLTVVTNRNSETREVQALRKPALSNRARAGPLDLRWPAGIASLSHLALPFPSTDRVDGELGNGSPDRVSLGDVELRGERGMLLIPANLFLRLRYNPFYEYLEERVLAAIALAGDPSETLPAAIDPPAP